MLSYVGSLLLTWWPGSYGVIRDIPTSPSGIGHPFDGGMDFRDLVWFAVMFGLFIRLWMLSEWRPGNDADEDRVD